MFVREVALPFADRRQAGRILGELVAALPELSGPLVLGLPRGGVPVAAEVASAIDGELDILVVRKLGAPGRPELALGAIAGSDTEVHNDTLIRHLGITPGDIERVAERERVELARRERAYRGDRPSLALTDRQVVVVDDGLATGASMRVALLAARAARPARPVAAAPVGAPAACAGLADVTDDVVCAATPEPFDAVGRWYIDFAPTTDDEVRELLGR